MAGFKFGYIDTGLRLVVAVAAVAAAAAAAMLARHCSGLVDWRTTVQLAAAMLRPPTVPVRRL